MYSYKSISINNILNHPISIVYLKTVELRMKELMRLFYLARMFLNVFASSGFENHEQGLKVAELLMAPLLLPCRLNHILIDGDQTIRTSRRNKSRIRPQTPGSLTKVL